MGVPTTEVGYTIATTRRETTKVHKNMWWHWGKRKEKKIPPGAWMSVCCECCVLYRWRSLRRADHSSTGVLPPVVRRCVWFRNLVNEEAVSHWGLLSQKQTNKEAKICFGQKKTNLWNFYRTRRFLARLANIHLFVPVPSWMQSVFALQRYSHFYSRNPLIRINWDGGLSVYAENPDNWIFLLK